MPYSVSKPPDWLKSLPQGAIKLGVNAFNAVIDDGGAEEKARKAAWAAIKAKYERGNQGQWRAKTDVSLGDIERMLREALTQREKEAWLRDVYGSYIVYDHEGKFWRLPYSILDGEVKFATESTEVQQEWVETRSQQADQGALDDAVEILVRLDRVQDPEGAAWDVTICEPGHTKNGWFFPEEALSDAVARGLFDRVPVNLFELPKDATHVPEALFDVKKFLVKNNVGWIDQVRLAANQAVKGVLHFLESYKWLGKNLLAAMKQGESVYGLSLDAPARATLARKDDRRVILLSRFKSIDSVDIVTRPAAGGKFNRAVASAPKEVIMNKKQLWDLISEKRPDLLKGKDYESTTEEELDGLVRMAMDPPAPGQDAGNAGAGTAGDGAVQGGDAGDKKDEEVKLLRCEIRLKDRLQACDLPDLAKTRISKMFADRTFEPAELDQAIADEKDYLAEMAAAPTAVGQGDLVPGSRLVVGIGTLEKAQMGVDRMFGLTRDDMIGFARHTRVDGRAFFDDMRSAQDFDGFDDIPAFRGIREAYMFFTGDKEVDGKFVPKNLPPDLRAKMAITSTTFSYVLGNTLGRRMVSDYLATNFREDLLVSVEKTVQDFRQQEAVNVGYFGDLDDVDPEAADYEEIAGVTDEEATYTIAQKGNILTVTRKTIINDDLTVVQRLVSRLGRAARRTHAKYVWNKWVNNSNCSDATAWHTSDHGNLGAAALSITTALVAWKALAKMTEKDSGERLGLLDDPKIKPTLIHPPDLFDTADIVCNNENYPGATSNINDRNPMRNRLTPAQVSLLTDTADWGILAPKELVDHVEMGYLHGRKEPEMFVADSPQSEQVFVADKIRYKIRHEYAGSPVDYRGSYKAEVA